MYLAFVLDLAAAGAVRAIRTTVRYEPGAIERKSNAFHWHVVRDVRDTVVVRGYHDGRFRVVGLARWAGDKLEGHQVIGSVPTDYQWTLVENALRALTHSGPAPAQDARWVEEVSRADLARLAPRAVGKVEVELEDGGQRAVGRARFRRRAGLVTGFGVGVLAVAMIIALVATRRRAPTPSAPAPIAAPAIDAPPPRPLRWADVEGSETTLGHVMREPAAEHGRRLCVQGTVGRIERRDVDGVRAFDGELTTAEGDAVHFVVHGAVGDVVKRSVARLCGRVDGMQGGAVKLRGMIDLPENRAPLVEQER